MFSNILDADSPILRKFAFGASQRKRVYQKLGQMVKNGMSVPMALDTLIDQQKDRGASRATLVAILSRWRRGMLDGRDFSQVARLDLPQADLVLLRAGERSGQLHRSVDNVLFLQESVKKMKGAIYGGLAYPGVLLLLAIAIMNFVAYAMVPVYAEFAPPETWTGMAGALASGAWFVVHILPFIITMFVIFISVSIWSLPRWTGSGRMIADRFLPWSVYKLFNGTSFLIALAGLVREGVKTNDALVIIMEGATPWYRERISATLRRMEDGEKIATALHNTGFDFPDREIVDDLRAYESFDNFDEMIEALARDALETALERIRGQMKIAFNLGMVIFALVLIWYVMGMAGMNQMVGEMASK